MGIRILLAIVLLSLGMKVGAQSLVSSSQLNRFQISLIGYDYYSAMGLLEYLNNSGIDISGINWEAGYVETIVSTSDIALLTSYGLNGQIVESNALGTENAIEADDRYLNPKEVEAILTQIANSAPELTQLNVIGKSFLGEPIYGLLLSTTPDVNNPSYHTKPSILIDGLHHAREVITPEISIQFAWSLLAAAYAENEFAIELIKRWNVWIVPMLNVDGSNIVWSKNSYWRKNARANGSRTFGVDVNRNYNYQFGKCRGSSGMKSSQTYRGEGPASEPETQALIGLAEAIKPAAYISYHSFSELVLIPYGCTGSKTGEHETLTNLAKEFALQLPTENGRGHYKAGTAWEILYGVDGDSMSHMFANYGAVSITLEVGTEFHPPYSKRDNLVNTHTNALLWLFEKMSSNMFTLYIDNQFGFVNEPALIEVLPIEHTQGERPFATNRGNYFHKVLMPGEYLIRVVTRDGRKAEKRLTMTGRPQSMTISL